MDRSLGRGVGHGLRSDGVSVIIHDERFQPNTPDEVWLTEAGKNGWIILTKDKNIRFRSIEKEALIAAKSRAFVLTSGNLTGQQMLDVIREQMIRILRYIKKNDAPFIARINKQEVAKLL